MRALTVVVAAVACLAGSGAATGRPAPGLVVVPRVTSHALSWSYRRVHRAGLAVALSRGFSTGTAPSDCGPVVAGQRPRAGRRVARTRVVRLLLARPRCAVGSPALPTGALPSYRVPDFVGGSVSAAAAWAARHGLSAEELGLPALRAGRAPELLGNYLVTRQRPRAGRRLSLGIGSGGGDAGSFRVTPLVLHGRVRPSAAADGAAFLRERPVP